MSFVAFVLLLLYLCLANINSWTAAGSSRAAAVWAGRGIERTNAKCVDDDSFSWVIASARLCDACRLLVLLLRECVYCCYRLIYCYRRRCCTLFALVLCLFIHLPIVVVVNIVIIIIVGFLGKTRTHIVPEHDANDTFPQKHKQKKMQKQTKTTAISRCISAIPPTIMIPLKFRKYN